MELHVRVLLREPIHQRRAVRREVVENHVHPRSAGCVATISARKVTNSWLVWRARTALVNQFLQQRPNVQFHFTPTYSSSLNQVESWFSKLQRDVIDRGIFPQ